MPYGRETRLRHCIVRCYGCPTTLQCMIIFPSNFQIIVIALMLSMLKGKGRDGI